MERRIITTEVTEEDKVIEPNLRPQLLDEYIGQEKIKNNLKVYIDAAKARGERKITIRNRAASPAAHFFIWKFLAENVKIKETPA